MRSPQDADAANSDDEFEPVKLSVSVSSDIGQRLRRIAFDERLSESSIVQIALKMMFARSSDEKIGEFLREQGASLRRG